MTHYDLNHAFMRCISLHHLFTFLIRRMSEYSKHETRIRLDEYMETYDSTNRIFGFDRIKMLFTGRGTRFLNVKWDRHRLSLNWGGSHFNGSLATFKKARWR